uniref:Uncharacterized protein n=1 Tax=Tanacetum cinerariifolium TaxID=118510 RepID=A0A6L2NHF1_TANCI|nr:hypothetical protein [Tanacetum cinerariifolium]
MNSTRIKLPHPFKPANETNGSFRTIELERLATHNFSDETFKQAFDLLDSSGTVLLPSSHDNVVEKEDGGWICFLGGNNYLGTKKYQGSNSGDGGNTGDGVKITGGVIGFGGGIGDAVTRRTSMARKK